MTGIEVTETWWWWAQACATWALFGLIWMVQWVVYPLMARQSAAGWVAWHTEYTRRMGAVVGPLMMGEMAGAVWWWWQEPASVWAALAFGLVVVNWLSTGLVQVPLHRKLALGYDAGAIRRLVVTNWIRTVAWTARAGLMFGMIVT